MTRKFVKTREDTPKMFDLVDKTIDQMPLLYSPLDRASLTCSMRRGQGVWVSLTMRRVLFGKNLAHLQRKTGNQIAAVDRVVEIQGFDGIGIRPNFHLVLRRID